MSTFFIEPKRLEHLKAVSTTSVQMFWGYAKNGKAV